jgi:F0F1-type ATP synthase assembly protein I
LENQRKKKKQLNTYIKYSGLASQMAVIIIAGTFFGDYLDSFNNAKTPIYTIIFSLSSIFLALYYVLKKITNQNEKK